MRILHTSDWHLGNSLYGRRRYEEFERFLEWLLDTIKKEEIDVLLISGDVFDSPVPGNRALELYYGFLCSVARSVCRHVVVTGGNHDSPSLLNAPKELLGFLDVHVFGSLPENPDECVILLGKDEGDGVYPPEDQGVIVCAVPYLRDRDIRRAEANESMEDKNRRFSEGIYQKYDLVCKRALEIREKSGINYPVIATGHLFATGGKTTEGDGVRELYVGTLCRVDASHFPECIDYLALGHLHIPQTVGGNEKHRYSGSPLPMGFGEAKQQKKVIVAELSPGVCDTWDISVPVLQRLETVRGDLDDISGRINGIIKSETPVWAEVIYEGQDIVTDLSGIVEGLVKNSCVEILRIKNNRFADSVLRGMEEGETLDDLSEMDVFRRCLSYNQVPSNQHESLIATYSEVLNSLFEEDTLAE